MRTAYSTPPRAATAGKDIGLKSAPRGFSIPSPLVGEGEVNAAPWPVFRREEKGFRWIPGACPGPDPGFAGMTEERHSVQGNLDPMPDPTVRSGRGEGRFGRVSICDSAIAALLRAGSAPPDQVWGRL